MIEPWVVSNNAFLLLLLVLCVAKDDDETKGMDIDRAITGNTRASVAGTPVPGVVACFLVLLVACFLLRRPVAAFDFDFNFDFDFSVFDFDFDFEFSMLLLSPVVVSGDTEPARVRESWKTNTSFAMDDDWMGKEAVLVMVIPGRDADRWTCCCC